MESYNNLLPSSSMSDGFKNEIVDDDIEICFRVTCTKFALSFPLISQKSTKDCIVYDEDGDIVVPRIEYIVPQVAIEHCTKTYLNTAGLQIWSGCFLLSDYILSISSSLQDQYILELGAGTGLCSIVASMFANHVFATDGNLEVLDNCQKNIMHHKYELARKGAFSGKVAVKLMEWGHRGHCLSFTESSYGWTEEEKELLNKVSLYLASDVIYDDNVTDNFFETIVSLMENNAPSTLYMSLEKRVNFVLETLSVRSPAHDHFKQHCDMISWRGGELNWNIQKIEIDFPQFFPYERNGQMELWKFHCQPKASRK